MMRLFLATALVLLVLLAPAARADTPGFSWLEASVTSSHPHQGDTGHGGRLALSYALSNQAFMDFNAEQQDFDFNSNRRYGFGVGINSDPGAGYVLFACVGWNNMGSDNDSVPGRRAHGYDAGVGVRSWLGERWEVDVFARYTHNRIAAATRDGSVSLWYAVTPQWNIGAGLDVNPGQTTYRVNLRIYY